MNTCRLGYSENYEADARYCHEHGGWFRPHAPGARWMVCDLAPAGDPRPETQR